MMINFKSLTFFCYVFYCFYFDCYSLNTIDSSFVQFVYDNGSIRSKGLLVDGKPDGYWYNYYDNGTIKSEGNRVEFLLNGLWKFYNVEGKLTHSINYLADKKNGDKITYNTITGDISTLEIFKLDTIFKRIEFYNNNSIHKVVQYKNGKEEGIAYELSKDSIIIALSLYKKGFLIRDEKINKLDSKGFKQGKHIRFYNGTTVENIVCTYTDDKLNGYLKEFDKKGNLIKVERWSDGLLMNNSIDTRKLEIKRDYYDSGRLKSIGTYFKGRLEGRLTTYNENGTISNSANYIDDVLISDGLLDENNLQQGLWREYYVDGEKKGEGHFKDGKKVGEWNYFYSNGKVEQQGLYYKGKPDGNWFWYHEDGTLRKSELYNKGIIQGKYLEINELGDTIILGQFIDGEANGLWKIIDNDVRIIGEFKDNLKTGLWKTYNRITGKLVESCHFSEGLENGKFLRYYDNGVLELEGFYEYGNKCSKWKHYDKNAVLFSFIEYNGLNESRINGIKIPFIDEEPINSVDNLLQVIKK